jgi:hypothetical protein
MVALSAMFAVCTGVNEYKRITDPEVQMRATSFDGLVAFCPTAQLRGCVLEFGGRLSTRGMTVGELVPMDCERQRARLEQDCAARDLACLARHQAYSQEMQWAPVQTRLSPNEYRMTCDNGHGRGDFSGPPLFSF